MWVEFVVVFNRHYFSELVKQRKVLEFSNLTQEDDTVLDYTMTLLALE